MSDRIDLIEIYERRKQSTQQLGAYTTVTGLLLGAISRSPNLTFGLPGLKDGATSGYVVVYGPLVIFGLAYWYYLRLTGCLAYRDAIMAKGARNQDEFSAAETTLLAPPHSTNPRFGDVASCIRKPLSPHFTLFFALFCIGWLLTEYFQFRDGKQDTTWPWEIVLGSPLDAELRPEWGRAGMHRPPPVYPPYNTLAYVLMISTICYWVVNNWYNYKDIDYRNECPVPKVNSMKRFIAICGLIIVAALGIAWGAGFFKKPNAVAFDVPPPCTMPPDDLLIHSQVSVISLPLSISEEELQTIFELNVPKQFVGNDHVDLPVVTDERLEWSLTRASPCRVVIDTDGVRFSVDLTGSGKLSAKAAVVDGSADIAIAGSLYFRLLPAMNEAWELTPNVTVEEYRLAQAEVPIRILGQKITSIGIENLIKTGIDENKDQWVESINREIAEALNLRQFVEQAWHQLHMVTKVANIGADDQIGVWVVISPRAIAFRALDYSRNGRIRAGFSIYGNVSSRISTNVPPSPTVQPLPTLKISNEIPTGFEIRVPAWIGFDALNAAVDSHVQGKTFSSSDGRVDVMIEDALVVGRGVEFFIKGKVVGRYEQYEAGGTLYFVGEIALDKDSQQLRVVDLRYTVETKDVVVKMADWLLNESLAEELQELLVVDLTDELEQAIRLANDELQQLIAEIPKEIDPEIQLDSLEVDQVVIAHGALFAILIGKGTMSATVRKTS